MVSAGPRKVTSERHESQGSASRELHKRWRPFIGPFFAAFPGLITAWIMHYYLHGFDLTWTFLKWRPIDWHLAGSGVAQTITTILLTVTAGGLSVFAWHAADNRKLPLRVALTGSVAVAVLDFGIQTGVGPGRWTSFFGLIVWWIIAGMWTLPRLDVTRRDSRSGEPQEVKPDPVEEKMGLVGAKYKPTQYTLDGEVVRTDIEVTMPRGGTLDTLDKAVPIMESLADSAGVGAPPDMSNVQRVGRASKAIVSLIHKDILKDGVPPEPPELKPDGSRYTIDERPLAIGRCMDLRLATETLRSTQGVIGTIGSGKSQYARRKIAVISTRSWVAPPLYFDKVKGRQTVAPLVGALGVIVLSNDPTPHRAGLMALKAMTEYRADLFGRLGYDEWEPGIIDPDTGEPVPKMVAWFEECDELIKLAPGVMTFLASKARSTGVVLVYSLQRPDHKAMPTELRANIVNWDVFGIMPGDDYTATMALSDDLISKGARPFWGDSKPGYHYRTERETLEDRWVIVRRVSNDSRQQIEAVTKAFGPGMTPLDSGTIAASGGWYEQAAEEAIAIKATMSAKGSTVKSPAPTPVKERPVTGDSEGDFADDGDDAYTEDGASAMEEVEQEMAEYAASGEIPANPDPGDTLIDIDAPVPPLSPDDEDDSWEDEIGGKPAPRDRETALAALWRTLYLISQDESLRSPADPAVTLLAPHHLFDRYPFRSRPWFSEQLAGVIVGEIEIPERYGMTLMVDEDENDNPDDAPYHLHRVADAEVPPPINAQ
jgi:hypothetical protein